MRSKYSQSELLNKQVTSIRSDWSWCWHWAVINKVRAPPPRQFVSTCYLQYTSINSLFITQVTNLTPIIKLAVHLKVKWLAVLVFHTTFSRLDIWHFICASSGCNLYLLPRHCCCFCQNGSRKKNDQSLVTPCSGFLQSLVHRPVQNRVTPLNKILSYNEYRDFLQKF